MNRIMAPFAAPQKRRVCREKAVESGGPCPLGAAMDSSAFLADARSTATTGARPSRPAPHVDRDRGAAAAGDRVRTMAPTVAPPEVAALQETWRTAPGADALGGRDELDCLSVSRREKYCHNEGMAFAHHHGVGLPGSTTAIMAPSGGP
jgi:hypothetical protein